MRALWETSGPDQTLLRECEASFACLCAPPGFWRLFLHGLPCSFSRGWGRHTGVRVCLCT